MENKKQNYLNLPKSREVEGESLPYMSYSQYSSFKEENEEFRNQMILKYIFGKEVPSRFQIFADFGSHCGEYIETQGKKRGDLLSDSDCEILDKVMKDSPKDSEYEREVWIDRGKYFILGYTDRWVPVGINEEGNWCCDVEDFKTGNVAKKKSFYASGKYGQTTLYSFFETKNGLKVRRSFVTMLDRKGNPMSETNPTKLELTGLVERIETPYTEERAEKLLEDMDKTAERLATLKETHKALSKIIVKV